MTATSIMILGESGTGKSTSMRGLDIENTLLIQSIPKQLPFKGAAKWKIYNKETCPTGNRVVTDNADTICSIMKSTKRKVIIIDDVQFIMSNRLMDKAEQRGNSIFEEYRQIARDIYKIMMTANSLSDDCFVFFMWHPDFDDEGKVIVKTVGKQTEKINTPPGFFSIVLRTVVNIQGESREYNFRTQTDGRDPAKSPDGMFDYMIPNDLDYVVKKVKEFYSGD